MPPAEVKSSLSSECQPKCEKTHQGEVSRNALPPTGGPKETIPNFLTCLVTTSNFYVSSGAFLMESQSLTRHSERSNGFVAQRDRCAAICTYRAFGQKDWAKFQRFQRLEVKCSPTDGLWVCPKLGISA